jgi:hypothetical protein
MDTPPEGSKQLSAEIIWGITALLQGGGLATAVRFDLAGNSPVPFTQIAALSVDNTRCGSALQIAFPDTGFILNVPNNTGGTYPVFTNATSFFVVAPDASVGDHTVLQVLNFMPPAISLQLLPKVQSAAAVAAVPLATNGTTPILTLPAATPTGRLRGLSGNVDLINTGAAIQNVYVSIIDGTTPTPKTLWLNGYSVAAGATVVIPVNVSGLNIPFSKSLSVVIAGTTLTGGFFNISAYYET